MLCALPAGIQPRQGVQQARRLPAVAPCGLLRVARRDRVQQPPRAPTQLLPRQPLLLRPPEKRRSFPPPVFARGSRLLRRRGGARGGRAQGGAFWAPPHIRVSVLPPREAGASLAAGASPPRMPRVLHQTFPSWGELKPRQLRSMETWRRLNPTYEIRYWTDSDCEEFVRTIFPELLPSFVGLARAVERADFFRYLVVFSFGGFYADTDVDCTQPLDSWVPPQAAFVVGLENEFATPAEATRRTYAEWTVESGEEFTPTRHDTRSARSDDAER